MLQVYTVAERSVKKPLTSQDEFCSIEKIMRITGGTGRGRKLKVPSGSRVRPTSDKVKQALFNILGESVRHARILDLYAGTGGVGIEALSRGAASVSFVDVAGESLKVIRLNIDQAGLSGRARLVASKAEAYLARTEEQFDIIFLDPPYAVEQGPLLELISASRVLLDGSVVVFEHFKKQTSPGQAGRLALYREAQYGDTVLAFYKARSHEPVVRSQSDKSAAS